MSVTMITQIFIYMNEDLGCWTGKLHVSLSEKFESQQIIKILKIYILTTTKSLFFKEIHQPFTLLKRLLSDLRGVPMFSNLRDPHLTRNIDFILWRLFIFIKQFIVGCIQTKQPLLVVAPTKNHLWFKTTVTYQHHLTSLNLERLTSSGNIQGIIQKKI